RAATISWTNTAGGNWNTAANWSPNQVPGPLDTAIVSLSSAVTNSTPTAVSNVTFTGGALNGSGPLTVGGTMNWLGGDLNGALTIALGGTLNISNTMQLGFNNGSGNGGGALTNFGTVVWAAGAGSYLYGYGGATIYNG